MILIVFTAWVSTYECPMLCRIDILTPTMVHPWSLFLGLMMAQSEMDMSSYNQRHLVSPTGMSHTLQLRHNERDGVSNHRRLDCLFNRLFRPR